MAIRVSEPEIQRLIRYNRSVVQELGRNFIGDLDLQEPFGSTFSRGTESALNKLDAKLNRWADRNIVKTYGAARRSTEKKLRAHKRYISDPALDERFSKIHKGSLNSLLNDPLTGFMSGVRKATGEVRGRVQLIKNQVTSLKTQRNVIHESIARVGLLGKENLNFIRDGIVNELISADKASNNIFRNKFKMLGNQNLFSNIANVSFVTFSNGKGGVRHVRLDSYVEGLGRVKAAQSITAATRNTLLRHGQDLIQISRSKSKVGDFCDIYSGKVFALTKEASMQWGVPHVSQLPNGGAPFHPNCKHTEEPYFPSAVSVKQREKDMAPGPSWSLDSSAGQVQAIHAKSRKAPKDIPPKLLTLGPGMTNWDHRVLGRMMGEPIGTALAVDQTFVGGLKRQLAQHGVRKSSDLLLLGRGLHERLRPSFERGLQESKGYLGEFRKSIRAAFTRFKNKGEGAYFPDPVSGDLFSAAASSFDGYQNIRKGFNSRVQEKTVSLVSKIRSMGVGPAKEGTQRWSKSADTGLVRGFNRTLSYFPTPWLLRSKKAGEIDVLEGMRAKEFGHSYYREVGPKKALFSVAPSHSRLPNVMAGGILLYLMSIRVKNSMPELRAFEKGFWDRLGPREKMEMLELLGHASSDIELDTVPELFAAGVQSVFGYNTDGLSREKLNSFVLGTYVGVP